MHPVLLPAAGRCHQPGAPRRQDEPRPRAGADLPTTGCRPGRQASHLREAPDSTGAVEGPAWQEEDRHVGVCLLGDNAEARGLGEGHVPEAVRDRDQLSADEPMPDPDDNKEVQRAVLVRGDRASAEEPVGVAASFRAVEPATRPSPVQLGSSASGKDAALAGACGRDAVWTGRQNYNRKIYAINSCDLTRPER